MPLLKMLDPPKLLFPVDISGGEHFRLFVKTEQIGLNLFLEFPELKKMT